LKLVKFSVISTPLREYFINARPSAAALYKGTMNAPLKKIAVIDFGSNALRLALGEFDGSRINVKKYLRAPIRLGADAFGSGEIKPETIARTALVFKRMAETINEFGAGETVAAGTSALRDAANAEELIEAVKAESGVELRVLPGKEEAELVFLALRSMRQYERILKGRCLLFDLGGGSAQISSQKNGVILASESLPIGAVRLFKQTRGSIRMEDADEFLDEPFGTAAQIIGGRAFSACILSGGNVDKFGEMRAALPRKRSSQILRAAEMKELVERLAAISPAQTIEKFDMKPDKADIIVHAGIIIFNFLKRFKIAEAAVSRAKLIDGLLLSAAGAELQARGADVPIVVARPPLSEAFPAEL